MVKERKIPNASGATPKEVQLEIALLRGKNAKLREAIDFMAVVSSQKNQMYSTLVKGARTNDQNVMSRLIRQLPMKDRPKVVEALVNLGEPGGDWHHGFNSGCLAMNRLFGGLVDSAQGDTICDDLVDTAEQKRETAMDEFPRLDS